MNETTHEAIPPPKVRQVVDFEPCANPPCRVYVPSALAGDYVVNGRDWGLIFKSRVVFEYCAAHTRVGRS